MPVVGDQVPWPSPPRDPGPWNGGPPVAPPGNTPLPPLPGAGGTMGGASNGGGWTNQGIIPEVIIPPDRPEPAVAAEPTKPKVDRSPVAVRAIAVLVVLVMVAGAAYVLVRGGREYPEAWDDRVAPIAAWVADERGLDFEHPVRVNFLSSEDYTKAATGGGDVTDADTAQFYADQAAQLRALGFLAGDVDLGAANDTLSDSGTLAYYDPELEQVFVRGTSLTPALEVTIAHELVHVLQDQHFDLERVNDYPDGRSTVLRALAEGDATRIEEAYVADVLTDDERTFYEAEQAKASEEAGDELEADVPPILTTLFSAPYVLGPRLLAVLDERGGNKAIDAAIQQPPSEEALYDPLLLDTDDLDPLTVDVSAPDGAEVLDQGEFGPMAWYLMLASRMDPSIALAAVDGWGGDAYVVYRTDDKVCVRVAAEGGGADETAQLAAAATTWAAAAPEGTAAVTKQDDGLLFRSCDPGTEAAPVGNDATTDLLVLPASRADVFVQALQADRSDEEGRCYANGVIDEFTWEQLSDPDGTFVSSDEGQRILQGVGQECFS